MRILTACKIALAEIITTSLYRVTFRSQPVAYLVMCDCLLQYLIWHHSLFLSSGSPGKLKLTEWQSTPFFTASFLPIIPGTRDFLKSDRLPPTHRILWISMKHHHTPFYMCTIRTGLSLWELHTLMFTVMRLVIITPCTLHLFPFLRFSLKA